jgi:hypothetical protein
LATYGIEISIPISVLMPYLCLGHDQLALSETEIVDMPQAFLPFAMDAKGETLYEETVEGKCLRRLTMVA